MLWCRLERSFCQLEDARADFRGRWASSQTTCMTGEEIDGQKQLLFRDKIAVVPHATQAQSKMPARYAHTTKRHARIAGMIHR